MRAREIRIPLYLFGGSNIGLTGCRKISLWLPGCMMEGNLQSGCKIARGRREAGSWLFSWQEKVCVENRMEDSQN